jgi:hypothetical protein
MQLPRFAKTSSGKQWYAATGPPGSRPERRVRRQRGEAFVYSHGQGGASDAADIYIAPERQLLV